MNKLFLVAVFETLSVSRNCICILSVKKIHLTDPGLFSGLCLFAQIVACYIRQKQVLTVLNVLGDGCCIVQGQVRMVLMWGCKCSGGMQVFL